MANIKQIEKGQVPDPQTAEFISAGPFKRILLLAVVILLLAQDQADAYIGPGAGFAVLGSALVMVGAMLAAIATLFTWPVRYLIRLIRGRRALARSRVKKVVVLGLDGMDPNVTEKYLAEGKLPHFAALQQKGCFQRLATSIPSISPVAWSSFQTGANPGKHNIFDFLSRDKNTYLPTLSSVSIRGPRRFLKLGKYEIPLGKPDIRLLRKGKPFWHYLGEHGIFSNILRVPITFPPEKFRGVTLSAMCVPDLRGSQGTFSYYTTRTGGEDEYTSGERFQLERNGANIKAHLVGPDNPIHREHAVMKCPFEISLNGKSRGKNVYDATLKLNGETYRLTKGKYTEWIPVDFKACRGMKVRGICQFLLINTEPEFELYVTPINIDPEKPVMPIAYPAVFATYLSKRQGRYATLGLAEDSWALNAKILNDETFLHQCLQADAEREAMFFDALDKVKRGLVVCVFDGTDRVQHTFWREIDAGHPADSDSNRKEDRIEKLYQRMDEMLGRVLKKCDNKDTMLFIISDHGFNTFRYGVDLNRWLEEKGYLTLKEDGRGKQYLQGVDWSRTKAYSIGLAGIFLNLKGRESQGIVDPGKEAADLRDEIAAKLKELIDPQRNCKAVNEVYNAMKVYTGPYKTEAPDLLVGFNTGYRVSWDGAIGKPTDEIFHDNVKPWSGDHCIDPALVPGVLFCNREITTDNPRLMDIGPTILDMFGVDVPKHMDGKPLKVEN